MEAFCYMHDEASSKVRVEKNVMIMPQVGPRDMGDDKDTWEKGDWRRPSQRLVLEDYDTDLWLKDWKA